MELCIKLCSKKVLIKVNLKIWVSKNLHIVEYSLFKQYGNREQIIFLLIKLCVHLKELRPILIHLVIHSTHTIDKFTYVLVRPWKHHPAFGRYHGLFVVLVNRSLMRTNNNFEHLLYFPTYSFYFTFHFTWKVRISTCLLYMEK